MYMKRTSLPSTGQNLEWVSVLDIFNTNAFNWNQNLMTILTGHKFLLGLVDSLSFPRYLCYIPSLLLQANAFLQLLTDFWAFRALGYSYVP